MARIVAISILLLSTSMAPAFAQCSAYPYTLTNGTVANATEVMANFGCAALTSGAALTGSTLIGDTYVNGSLGVGTSSPAFRLHVVSPSGDYGARIFGSATVGASYGGSVIAGTNSSDISFVVRNNSNSSTYFLVRGDGNVGVGTPNPEYLLTVNGTAYAAGGAGALSDVRHKKHVRPLRLDAIRIVRGLKPVTFHWKEPKDDGMKGRQLGFIAQDVQSVLPDAVLISSNAEKTLGLKYNELLPVLTRALQQQQDQIERLRAENIAKANEVRALRSAVLDGEARLQAQIIGLRKQMGVQAAQR